MAKTKKQNAAEFIKKIQSEGYMVYVGGAGQARTSPLLPADKHATMTELNDKIVEIIRSGDGA